MEETYANDQEMMEYFCQLILEKEVSVADHPGYQAAETKGLEVDPLDRTANDGGRFKDGAAATKDAARVDSKIEGSMS